MSHPKKQGGSPVGLEGYRPSRAERVHMSQFDIVDTVDGEIEITTDNPEQWEPSERQLSFLRNLFDRVPVDLMDSDGEPDCNLSLSAAMRALEPQGTSTELKRWCRLEPGFLVLFKEKVKEQLDISSLGADLTVAGAADGAIRPTLDQKWAIGALLKVREFVHRKEIRFLQINQQFNFIGGDASNEDLQRIINAGSNTAQKAIEAG